MVYSWMIAILDELKFVFSSDITIILATLDAWHGRISDLQFKPGPSIFNQTLLAFDSIFCASSDRNMSVLAASTMMHNQDSCCCKICSKYWARCIRLHYFFGRILLMSPPMPALDMAKTSSMNCKQFVIPEQDSSTEDVKCGRAEEILWYPLQCSMVIRW